MVRRITNFRRALWKWMNGPGINFRDPRPNGTNYMGAYDLKTGKRLTPSSASTATPRRRRDGLDEPFRKSSNDALNRAVEAQRGEYDDAGRNNLDVDDSENYSPGDSDGSPAGGAGRGSGGGSRGDEDEIAGLPHSTTGSASAVVRFPPSYDTSLYPFPLNAYFRSQPVLSEEFRQEIFERVVERGWSVREVSAAMGVSMERVAAVVRLGEVEKRWEGEGKPLATVYARAVLSMLPKTPYKPQRTSAFSKQQQQPHFSKPSSHLSSLAPPPPSHSSSSGPSGPSSASPGSNPSHEPINDLPIHAATRQQLFHPVVESAHFTRADAAHVFNRHLLPADARIPHAELIDLERDRLTGVDRKLRDARLKNKSDALDEEARRRVGRSINHNNDNNKTSSTKSPISPSLNPPNLHARTHSTKSLKVVPTRRWTFMFQNVTVDADASERHGQLIQSKKLAAGRGGRVGGRDRYIIGERGLGAAVGTPGMNAGIDTSVAGAGYTGNRHGHANANANANVGGRVGWRYGVPHDDRKKGVGRIATFVD